MANNYEWSFPQLIRAATEGDKSDVVKCIFWKITATSDSHQDEDGNYLHSNRGGETGLQLEDGEEFVPYNDITPDWCKSRVLAHLDETEDEIKAGLDSDISASAAAQSNILAGTPW